MTYKDSTRRRALKEKRERAKLKPILAPEEAKNVQRFLGSLASHMGGKPRKVLRAPHAVGLGRPSPALPSEEIVP